MVAANATIRVRNFEEWRYMVVTVIEKVEVVKV